MVIETRVEYDDTIFEILEVKEKRIEKIKICNKGKYIFVAN